MILSKVYFLNFSLALLILFFTHNAYSICFTDQEENPESYTFYTGFGFAEHNAYSGDSYDQDDEEVKSSGIHVTLGCYENLRSNTHLVLEASFIEADNKYIGYYNEPTVLWLTGGLKVDLNNRFQNVSFIMHGGLSSSLQLVIGAGLEVPISKSLSLRPELKFVNIVNNAAQFSLLYRF